jgi:inner membrane protein involved in colicin E2 resistance
LACFSSEDIALLLGTLITFAVVTALMVVTRNIEQLRVFANGFWEQNDSEPA